MLIVNGKDTVVLHMPKCAGSSVRWAIINKYPEYRWSCEHAPIEALPEKYKTFRRIGFCRNPLTWYVSKFNFVKQNIIQNKGHASIIVQLSDNFNLTFEQTLPRMLDMQNFLDMNPHYLTRFKNQIRHHVMNRYVCHLAYNYSDVYNLTPFHFKKTLYDHWYQQVGLNTAIVYKMDDDTFVTNVENEFPGVKIGHRNKGNSVNYHTVYTHQTATAVYEADKQYFTKHDYNDLNLL